MIRDLVTGELKPEDNWGDGKSVHEASEPPSIETINDWAWGAGKNLPNHSASLAGLGKYVRQGIHEIPTFRTRQDAYRYAAWLITMAEVSLPDKEDCKGQTFEKVLDAVKNT